MADYQLPDSVLAALNKAFGGTTPADIAEEVRQDLERFRKSVAPAKNGDRRRELEGLRATLRNNVFIAMEAIVFRCSDTRGRSWSGRKTVGRVMAEVLAEADRLAGHKRRERAEVSPFNLRQWRNWIEQHQKELDRAGK